MNCKKCLIQSKACGRHLNCVEIIKILCTEHRRRESVIVTRLLEIIVSFKREGKEKSYKIGYMARMSRVNVQV